MRYVWIRAQGNGYGLNEMCQVLDVSESGYRAWKRGGKPYRKRLTDAHMAARAWADAVHAVGQQRSGVRDAARAFVPTDGWSSFRVRWRVPGAALLLLMSLLFMLLWWGDKNS